MRTDVKIGLAIGAIVLVVAVAYHGTKKPGDIELADGRPSDALIDELISPKAPSTVAKPAAKPAVATPPAQRTVPRSRVASEPAPANRPPVATPRTERRVPTQFSRTVPPAQHTQGEAPPQAPSRAATSADTPQTPGARPDTAAPEAAAEPDDAAKIRNRPRQVPTRQPVQPRTVPPARGDNRAVITPTAQPTPSAPAVAQQEPTARIVGQTVLPATGTASKAKTHVVQEGESLATLAERYYGSQRHTALLMAANPKVDPRRMRVGTTLTIPAAASEVPSTPGSTAPTSRTATGSRTYQVQEGDTFYGIAARELGNGGRWPEVYTLNKAAVGQDPNRLRAGMELQLPAK